MIVGLGIDVVELDRIAASLDRFGARFLERILAPEEIALMAGRARVPFLAARFAAKEAGAKALGTGMTRGVCFKSFIIETLPSGRPVLRLSGEALLIAREIGAEVAHVSLTHGRDVASAVVVLERPGPVSP